ncbi:amino acid ABC transporter substrate-binding protein [Lachnospiraceae bacterium OF09-33XD]|uniref:Transporter substrate-binding domain-containing protein n=2 Tax=Wansuia hejianensis TaxID=2763667 RepID=A0A7G9GHW4_9FIRM|nr:transporter substrate-binding domain-containing protein [Wansuia hejianensis]RHV92376.1 amino acid ABC transporter substrate-binding protein [Lachnospiraceae bacterium OF09-33XD]
MKKFAALMLSAVCMISLAACGSEPKSDAAAGSSSSEASGAVTGMDDLPGKKIGVQTGTTGDIYATDYEGDEAGTVVERYNKGVDAVMSLKQGKIDCVIIDNEPAKVFVSENDDLKILDEPFAEEEYAICVDKSNSELKDKINQALTDLKADGTLDEIIGHWIGDSADQKSYESAADADHSNGTLVMATNAEFPPYESLDGENVVGIDADIARAIADKLGMDLRIDNMEFDSIIMAVTSGKADIGVAGMTVTEDRLENVDFTDTYAKAKQVIIVKK